MENGETEERDGGRERMDRESERRERDEERRGKRNRDGRNRCMGGRGEEEMSKRCRAEIKGESLNRNGGIQTEHV